MPKAKIRIPTQEYGFIEFDVEATEEEIQALYYKLVNQYKDNFGLDVKEYNKALDQYLQVGSMEAELYEKMSAPQKSEIQSIKRAFARIKSKQ